METRCRHWTGLRVWVVSCGLSVWRTQHQQIFDDQNRGPRQRPNPVPYFSPGRTETWHFSRLLRLGQCVRGFNPVDCGRHACHSRSALTVLHGAPRPLFSLLCQLGSEDQQETAGVGGAWWKEPGPGFLCEAEAPSSLCWTMTQWEISLCCVKSLRLSGGFYSSLPTLTGEITFRATEESAQGREATIGYCRRTTEE